VVQEQDGSHTRAAPSASLVNTGGAVYNTVVLPSALSQALYETRRRRTLLQVFVHYAPFRLLALT